MNMTGSQGGIERSVGNSQATSVAVRGGVRALLISLAVGRTVVHGWPATLVLWGFVVVVCFALEEFLASRRAPARAFGVLTIWILAAAAHRLQGVHVAYCQVLAQTWSFSAAIAAATEALEGGPSGTTFSFALSLSLPAVALVRFSGGGLRGVRIFAVPMVSVLAALALVAPDCVRLYGTPADELGDLALVGGLRGFLLALLTFSGLTGTGVAIVCWLGDFVAHWLGLREPSMAPLTSRGAPAAGP